MVGSAIWYPVSRSRSSQSAFRRDNESLRVRVKRFCNEQFACVRSVCVSGIDQIDAELDCAAQDLERVLAVRWPTPNPFAGNPHRAKPEPVHCEVAAQLKIHIRGHFVCRSWIRSEDYIGFPGEKRCSTCKTDLDKSPPRDASPVISWRKLIPHGRPAVHSLIRLSTQLSCCVSRLH